MVLCQRKKALILGMPLPVCVSLADQFVSLSISFFFYPAVRGVAVMSSEVKCKRYESSISIGMVAIALALFLAQIYQDLQLGWIFVV